MTVGLEVFVQLVIAAITIEPSLNWPGFGVPFPLGVLWSRLSWYPSSAILRALSGAGPVFLYCSRTCAISVGADLSGTLSSGFRGPAIDGSILLRSIVIIFE